MRRRCADEPLTTGNTVAIDVRASDYPAGIAVYNGPPSAETFVTCSPGVIVGPSSPGTQISTSWCSPSCPCYRGRTSRSTLLRLHLPSTSRSTTSGTSTRAAHGPLERNTHLRGRRPFQLTSSGKAQRAGRGDDLGFVELRGRISARRHTDPADARRRRVERSVRSAASGCLRLVSVSATVRLYRHVDLSEAVGFVAGLAKEAGKLRAMSAPRATWEHPPRAGQRHLRVP